MLDYYYKFVSEHQEIYSCDMVRLNFELNNFDDFEKFITRYEFTDCFICNKFFNKKCFGYKDLFTFYIEKGSKKCSFSIGLGLNTSKLNQLLGFIEFNPNKCMQFTEFRYLYLDFLNLLKRINLKRYDLAIDLPIKRNEIKMVKNARCKYEMYNDYEKEGTIISRSFTEYQGVRNHNKFTKLYDKTKESKLDYDLTRIEFTFEKEEEKFENLPTFFIYNKNYYNSDLDFTSLSDTQLVLIDLLRNTDDLNFYLNRLNFRIKKKIEPFLNDYQFQLNLDLVKAVKKIALSFEF